jgi:hypothetical protein
MPNSIELNLKRFYIHLALLEADHGSIGTFQQGQEEDSLEATEDVHSNYAVSLVESDRCVHPQDKELVVEATYSVPEIRYTTTQKDDSWHVVCILAFQT